MYKLMDSQKTHEHKKTGDGFTENSRVKTDENSSCVKVRKNDGVEIIHECQRKRACQDVDAKPVVRDPMDDLTHIPFQPWCTSCVKGKAQAEPHKRTERIIEDRALPVIQCECLMLKDVAGTGGLKVLSMYVRTFGCM